MWLWLAIGSALLLGFYDVAKKQSLQKNDVMVILASSTALTALIMSPFLSAGSLADHLHLIVKATLVSASWVTGLMALKTLPLTTASTIKASRPVFVLLGSIFIFGERLNAMQWTGVLSAILSLWLLSLSNRKEGISYSSNKGLWYIWIAVATGVSSALYDKYIMTFLQPAFVQSWTNIYITLLLVLCILFRKHVMKAEIQPFRWDWMLLLIALFITGADYMYFVSLKCDGALLAVISIIRRCSVIVTFVFGVFLYKEKNVRTKALDLAILLAGMVFLVLGSR